jgi:prepilin-type N-terminal cleavage/methylation domain-containing protein
MKIKKGFTLIELLVVIGIMAVLAAGVVALINPLEKTRQANDANAQNAIGQYATAMQSSAAQSTTGAYPILTTAGAPSMFVTLGELTAAPVLPAGYTVNYLSDNTGSVAVVYVQMLSAKYTAKCTGAAALTPYWFYHTGNGRACGSCLAAAPTTAATTCNTSGSTGVAW